MVPSARRENFPTAIRYSQIFPWKTFFATRHLSQVKREGSLCASYPLMLSNFKCELTIPVPLSWPVSIPYYFPRFGNIKNCRNSDPLSFFLLRFKPSFIELILLSLFLVYGGILETSGISKIEVVSFLKASHSKFYL